MTPASPTTYALLGHLAVRPWTGYELTHQVRRGLRFVWPSSEGHLYREQRRLVELGWATVTKEPVGRRHRNRYTITDAGRAALTAWLATEPQPPRFEVEGILRLFHADHGSMDDLVGSMTATATMAGAMLEDLAGILDEYLDPAGPLAMLERGVGGPGDDRLEFHGRPQFPERLHLVALVVDVTTRLLAELEEAFTTAAAEVSEWPSVVDEGLVEGTRARLETTRSRLAARSR
jgi:PadR family transcriptional regulator, regulatory protein AphA